MMGPRHISEILPGVIEDICEASELTAAELKHRPWRTHTDEELGLTPECDDGEAVDLTGLPEDLIRQLSPELQKQAGLTPAAGPANKPSATNEPLVLGETLTEAEVVAICRAHFATFDSLQAAADHYGLTDGRLSQIQTGIYVSCPRILRALGIHHKRGVYRRIVS